MQMQNTDQLRNNMEITLERRYLGTEYTIGKLFVDNEYFCDTLEDTVRNIAPNGQGKISGKTAIPYGRYQVIVNHSPKFNRELPRLLNVPHFEGILIHRGNTATDSAGCIIVGENKVKGKVINSTIYEQKLTKLIKGSHSEVYINII